MPEANANKDAVHFNEWPGALQFYYTNLTQINKAHLDAAEETARSYQGRIDLIQKTTASITGMYASLLGIIFAVDRLKATSGSAEIPAVAIVPPLLLGTSLFLAVIASSALSIVPTGALVRQTMFLDDLLKRRNHFVYWREYLPWWKIYSLYLSIAFMGVGIVSLPLPFLDQSQRWPAWVVVGTLLLALSVATYLGFRVKDLQSSTKSGGAGAGSGFPSTADIPQPVVPSGRSARQ